MAKTAPVHTETIDNLLAAYNGERNAAARYVAFAVQADKEGYGGAASLFRAIAHAEQVHATNHARVLRKYGAELDVKMETPEVRSTRENLQAAMQGEEIERDQMYPEFAAQARRDNMKDAVKTFESAREAEGVHALMYAAALESLEDYRDRTVYFVCTICGWVSPGGNFTRCMLCHNPRERFDKID